MPQNPSRSLRRIREAQTTLSISGALLLALLVAACGDAPQVPTTAAATTTLVSSAVVATGLTAVPSVKVLDAKGKAIKNVMVRWRVTAGAGKVVNDSVRTSPAGDASSGGWTLGTIAGTQTLQATADGISTPVTFVAEAAPGPATTVTRTSTDAQQAVVNTVVATPPAARVEDQFGNAVSNVSVSFSTGDGGTIDGPQQTTNAQGIATATAWKLGTRAGQQFARATVTNVGQAAFSAVAIPGAPADLAKAGGDNQNGLNAAPIPLPPGVRVVDQFNNPVGNIPVSFTPGPNSGRVTGGVALTDPATGVAFVGAWILGDQPQQTLVAASGLVPGKTLTFTANATVSLYNIDVRFIGDGGTARQRDAFTNAAAKWRRVIVGHVHDVRLNEVAGYCASWIPAINEVISDVVIFARITPIDGVGRTLAQAGPCLVSLASRLTLYGLMEFDLDDLPSLINNGTIDDVVLHEMGHVLGIGTLWEASGRQLLSGKGTTDPFFTGAGARAEFPGIGGSIFSGTPVPVENTGGAGTRDSHWRNSLFGRELMQGFARAGGMPLSRVTAASLADLGYTVSLNNADPFRLLGSLREGFGLEMPLENDVANIPLYEVDASGRHRLIRPARTSKP